MAFRFFTIPALDPAAAEAALNAFCSQHRVLQVERRFIDAGGDSQWALCLQVADGPGPLPDLLKARPGSAATEAGARPQTDWKQLLSDADFAVFARLRALRKALAQAAGVPVYAVFSNEQLAAMVQGRVTTRAALEATDGVGAARLQRYGASVLACLASAFGAPGASATGPAAAPAGATATA